MIANRLTVFIDACVLAGALKRNLLLTLAEAEFFRLRWSKSVLDEKEKAITKILIDRGIDDFAARARKARRSMEIAFEDAMVENYETFSQMCAGLPDPDDVHVVAAALKTRATIIVTDNLKDFPAATMSRLNIEVSSSDHFLADLIALDDGRAVGAIRRMRERFRRPEKTAAALLRDMEANGLTQTADLLRPHVRCV